MILSREKINHLSKLIMKHILKDNRVEFFCDENDLRLEIVNVLKSEIKIESEIDNVVRSTIESYSKDIKEGSNEWNIIYQKCYNEENRRRRRLADSKYF